MSNDKIGCVWLLIAFSWLLLQFKDGCKNFYGYCKKRYFKYRNAIDYYKIVDKNDRIAEMNILYCKIKPVKPSDVYLKPAVSNSEESSQKLTGCEVCKRQLLHIKQSGESMKYTECGHVLCLTCANKFHDQMSQASFRSKWPCPACTRPLKRHGLIHVYNLYI